MHKTPTLTVIIPTFNEAGYIEDALKSVAFADEIILIDSFSEDATLTLATPHVSKVLSREFDNFSNQKNEALKHAKGQWVLFLDADERVTQSLEKEIKETIQNPVHSGYKINFPHFYMNRFLYSHSDDVLRLVKREGAHFIGEVHEKLLCNGSVGRLKNKMLHYTYKNLHSYITKKESYAWFQAKQQYAKGKRATWMHFWFKPLFRFFKSYIIKGGYKDGVPGLTVAGVNAYGVFQRYVKLHLLHKSME
ncbi:glycosyltransferase family 2 protein [Flavobacteriaceae bacterium]|nr:glycosyltransferase family 2 protein [Flavobacteriaceae bacterium]